MKKSVFLTFAIATVALCTLFLTSCDKKAATEPMHESDVTLTYTPNPAVANTTVNFNISVMESGMAADVSDASCEVAQGTTAMTPLTLTRESAGMYKGTYTFPMSGTHKLTFNYKHDGEMMMKEFTVDVK
jgi:uncharacterized lipoprotein NlpE involved in copper resistance